MDNKIKYSPTRLANYRKKLELEKQFQLAEIDQFIPKLIEDANKIIEFASKPADKTVQDVYKQALREIELQQRAFVNPSLFNKLAKSKRYDDFTQFKKLPADKMKIYRTIFTEKIAEIDQLLNNKQTAKITT